LTNGEYNEKDGEFYIPTGQPRYYYASDNIYSDDYIGLTPDDLIDIAVCDNLHFHGASQQGVVFHLMGALSEFGKFGAVCIGESPARARTYYDRTIASLNESVSG
jgi:hypothetical protein